MTLCLGSTMAQAEQVVIQTNHNTLVLDVTKGAQPKYVYYGTRLSDQDLQHLQWPNAFGRMEAYPAYGLNTPAEAALAMRHSDGNLSTALYADSFSQNGSQTTITLKDPVYPITVDLCYKAYNDEDIIEAWTEIKNNEKGTVTLTTFASAMLPIRRGDVWLSHLYGSWGNEAQLVEEPLTPGQKVIANKDGVRNSHTDHGEVMFSLNGKGQENTGDVIGAAICYSGNYRLKVTTDDTEYHYFFAGINEDNSEYHLKKGETFKTPALALSYSTEGLSGVSRNFHKWGRKYKLMHGDKERKILLNSWEGVYFDINQAGMDQMMKDIASMGGELFVMDDGWFGDKYPRKVDNSSLGDWVVDKNKLPEGIEGLLRDAKKNGVKFGIWIEPEMANTTSELYEKHPDWIVKAPKRDAVLGRGGSRQPHEQVSRDRLHQVGCQHGHHEPRFAVSDHERPEPPVYRLPPRSGEDLPAHPREISRRDDSGLRLGWWTSQLGCAALLRRVLGVRQYRRPAAHLHAMGNQLLLPRHRYGQPHLCHAKPYRVPHHSHEVPHRCSHERTPGHGDPTEEHDRRGEGAVSQGYQRVQADTSHRTVR